MRKTLVSFMQFVGTLSVGMLLLWLLIALMTAPYRLDKLARQSRIDQEKYKQLVCDSSVIGGSGVAGEQTRRALIASGVPVQKECLKVLESQLEDQQRRMKIDRFYNTVYNALFLGLI